jgi:hypothetical protein
VARILLLPERREGLRTYTIIKMMMIILQLVQEYSGTIYLTSLLLPQVTD